MTLGELRTASKLLNAALERYHTACLAIANCYDIDHGNSLKGISQAISDAIPSELELVISYEAKIQQIKATVSQTRNIIPSIAPISLLPADILTYIFQLVLNDKPCFAPSYDREIQRLVVNYPETLSHVCSRWRHVAINSPMLWSHIDLRLMSRSWDGYNRKPSGDYNTVGGRFLTRAKVFNTRTAHAPLEIHIEGGGSLYGDTNADLIAFCASIATRIRSLELSTWCMVRGDQLAAFRKCIENCPPETLYQLVIKSGEKSSDPEWPERPPSPRRRYHADPLASVRVLRLTGVFFPWTSPAYHGLVELHLTHYSQRSPLWIPQSDLVKILSASPGLRIFHFGLSITELVPGSARSSSVSLRDLEVVDLHPRSLDEYSVLLQLLSPGSNSLRLSLDLGSVVSKLSARSPSSPARILPEWLFANEFFSRSMVTELHIAVSGKTLVPHTSLLGLLRSWPLQRLQVLFISNFGLQIQPSDIQSNEPEHPLTGSELHTLRLSSCHIDLDHFQRATEIVSIQVLKITNCWVARGSINLGTHSTKNELAKIIPVVEFESSFEWPAYDGWNI